MKHILRALSALLALALLAACVPPQPYPASVNGELFFPADNGARADVVPADCLVTGDPCPSPVTLSLYPEEWNIASIVWSPDGATAVVSSADQPKDHLALFAPPSRQLRKFTSLAMVSDLSWSPDGKLLAVAGRQDSGATGAQVASDNIYLYSAAGKELRNLTADMPGMKNDASWLTTDMLLFQNVLLQDDCNIYTLTISSGDIVPWTALSLCEASPAVSPDGAWVAYVFEDNLYLADASGSNTTLILDLPEPIARPSWSPDGQWIAFDETDANAVGVVKPDGTSYVRTGEGVYSAGFAPLVDEALLLTTAPNFQLPGKTTASWFVTPIPDGPTRPVIVPGIPPAEMPVNISWRPREQ